ncbi:MAG TPA: OmpA family protein [Candidatus Obscuribacter sp.]|nr:OmpA family protein [Candidatus Obscuribacter sp.]
MGSSDKAFRKTASGFALTLALLGTAFPASSAASTVETESKQARSILHHSDLTSSLRLVPGMLVTVHTFDGLDTHWQTVGDYDFIARVAECESKGKGFIYDWQMSSPADASGSRKVEDVDVRHSHKVSLFYPKHEVCTLVGYTNVLRVSDDLYNDLKAGRTSDFMIDGPESIVINHGEVTPLPRKISPAGIENVKIRVEGQDRELRAIKTVCDNGWNYWVLDNPQCPMLIQGNAPFRWVVSLGKVDGDGAGDANQEARNIYDQLKRNGIATSYLILFDFDSDRLRPHSKEILLSLSRYLKKDKALKLQVEGHTCTIGGYDYNMQLSRKRAQSVRRYLTESCSIEAERLKAVGLGYTKPEKSNATSAGRERNRRVVFREIK